MESSCPGSRVWCDFEAAASETGIGESAGEISVSGKFDQEETTLNYTHCGLVLQWSNLAYTDSIAPDDGISMKF